MLPHGLKSEGRSLSIDFVLLLNANFDVVVDMSPNGFLTVINNGSSVDTCVAYVEYWQQVTGIVPETRQADPIPSPVVARSAAFGGGIVVGAQVKVTYVATGSEGTDFRVPIGTHLLTNNYEITWAPKGVVQVPFIDLPDGVGDRTQDDFRVVTGAPLNVGDKLLFVLFI